MIVSTDGTQQQQLSNSEYHSNKAVSKSQLDVIRRSPMHYRYMLDNPGSREETPAMRIGTAVHAIVLEPAEFAANYVLSEKFDRRTKAGKEAAAAFDAENEGKITLDPDEWIQVHMMRDSIMRHPAARALFGSKGVAEASVFWTDPRTGMDCRCRPDFWRPDLRALVDLKTTEDASPEEFARSILKYRYHVQHAFYVDGLNAAAPADQPKLIDNFIFVAVEKKAPYAVGVYVLDAESIALGRLEYESDLAKIYDCMCDDSWPAYGDKIQNISLPAWHLARHSHLLGQ